MNRAAVSWGGGSTFGSGEQNIEVWKPVRRLAGHESGKYLSVKFILFYF